jgi:hypothetical protein
VRFAAEGVDSGEGRCGGGYQIEYAGGGDIFRAG